MSHTVGARDRARVEEGISPYDAVFFRGKYYRLEFHLDFGVSNRSRSSLRFVGLIEIEMA